MRSRSKVILSAELCMLAMLGTAATSAWAAEAVGPSGAMIFQNVTVTNAAPDEVMQAMPTDSNAPVVNPATIGAWMHNGKYTLFSTDGTSVGLVTTWADLNSSVLVRQSDGTFVRQCTLDSAVASHKHNLLGKPVAKQPHTHAKQSAVNIKSVAEVKNDR
jgi:hypothetical protein